LFCFFLFVRLPLRAADNPNVFVYVFRRRVSVAPKNRYVCAMAFEAPQQVSSGGLCALCHRRVCSAPGSGAGF